MDGSFFAPKSAWRLERAGGETVDIPSPAYIGRGIDCDVRIEDQRVSRHHVCIDHGKLTNLSTQNPVWVDGNEVPPKGTATLEHKSEIKLPGSNTFRYLSYEPQTWQRTGSYSQPREGMHIPEEQLGGAHSVTLFRAAAAVPAWISLKNPTEKQKPKRPYQTERYARDRAAREVEAAEKERAHKALKAQQYAQREEAYKNRPIQWSVGVVCEVLCVLRLASIFPAHDSLEQPFPHLYPQSPLQL